MWTSHLDAGYVRLALVYCLRLLPQSVIMEYVRGRAYLRHVCHLLPSQRLQRMTNQVVSSTQRRYASHRTARWRDHPARGNFRLTVAPPRMSRPCVLVIGLWLVQLLRRSQCLAAMRHTTRLLDLRPKKAFRLLKYEGRCTFGFYRNRLEGGLVCES